MKTYKEHINENVNWNKKLIDSTIESNLDGIKIALNNGANIHTKNDMCFNFANVNDDIDILDTVKYIFDYIWKTESTYLNKLIPKLKLKSKKQLYEFYPWIFAVNDHGLI